MQVSGTPVVNRDAEPEAKETRGQGENIKPETSYPDEPFEKVKVQTWP